MLSSNVCPLCNNTKETSQHIFFKCVVAQKVCDVYDSWIGSHSVRHKNAANNFASFHLVWCNNKVNTVWRGMWVATIWEIWKHMNNVIFNNGAY